MEPEKNYDFTKFADFFGTDREMLFTTLEVFHESIPLSNARVYEAIKSGNNEQLHINAHSLKSYVAYFTEGSLYQKAHALEVAGQEKQLPAKKDYALSIYEEMQPMLMQLIGAIEAELHQLEDS